MKEEGIAFQDKYGQPTSWDKYQLLYEHNFPKSVIPINKFFSIMRSLVPRVYFRNPKVMVTPRQPGYYWKAQIVEKIDNWLIVEKKFKEQIKMMIQDCFTCGLGIGIPGYDNFVAYTGEETSGETDDGEKFELNVNIKPGEPWFERVDPRDIIFPYGTKSVSDMPWFGQKVVRYTHDVKNDPRFKSNAKGLEGKDASEFVSESIARDPAHGKINRFQEQTELWIFRNARTRKVLVMAKDHDKLLFKDDDALQIEGLPINVLTFNPTGRSIYGIPDARIILPQQNQYNDINTLIAAHAYASIRKWAIDQNLVADDEWQKAMSNIVGTTIKVDGDPKNAITQFSLTIPRELMEMLEIVDRAFREQIGFARQAQGEFSPGGRKTAYEVKTVDQALAIRIDERRDAVAEILTQVVSKWNQYIFKFWDEPTTEALVGADGEPHWVQFTGEDISSEYTYQIDPDDAVPTSGEMRKMETMQIAEQLMQVPEINKEELIRQSMKHFPGFNVDALLRQPGTPPVPQGAPQGMDEFEQEQGQAERVKPIAEFAAAQQQAQMEGGQ